MTFKDLKNMDLQDTSGMCSIDKKYYLRFGDIPDNETSLVWCGEQLVGTENGVSVYNAILNDDGSVCMGVNLPFTKTTLDTVVALVKYGDRKCYLVQGDEVGHGSDGEPLLKNVKIIKEIKYRQK